MKWSFRLFLAEDGGPSPNGKPSNQNGTLDDPQATLLYTKKKSKHPFDPVEFEDDMTIFDDPLPDGYESWTDAQKWMHHYIKKMRADDAAARSKASGRPIQSTPPQKTTIALPQQKQAADTERRSNVVSRFINYLRGRQQGQAQ